MSFRQLLPLKVKHSKYIDFDRREKISLKYQYLTVSNIAHSLSNSFSLYASFNLNFVYYQNIRSSICCPDIRPILAVCTYIEFSQPDLSSYFHKCSLFCKIIFLIEKLISMIIKHTITLHGAFDVITLSSFGHYIY